MDVSFWPLEFEKAREAYGSEGMKAWSRPSCFFLFVPWLFGGKFGKIFLMYFLLEVKSGDCLIIPDFVLLVNPAEFAVSFGKILSGAAFCSYRFMFIEPL